MHKIEYFDIDKEAEAWFGPSYEIQECNNNRRIKIHPVSGKKLRADFAESFAKRGYDKPEKPIFNDLKMRKNDDIL